MSYVLTLSFFELNRQLPLVLIYKKMYHYQVRDE